MPIKGLTKLFVQLDKRKRRVFTRFILSSMFMTLCRSCLSQLPRVSRMATMTYVYVASVRNSWITRTKGKRPDN